MHDKDLEAENERLRKMLKLKSSSIVKNAKEMEGLMNEIYIIREASVMTRIKWVFTGVNTTTTD